MSLAEQPLNDYVTAEQYLEAERLAQTKNEWLRGAVRAMSGARRAHNLLAHNLHGILYRQLGSGPCEVYAGEMRVKAAEADLYAYPDVVVTCEEQGPQLEDRQLDTLLNPTLLIEILSPSTESFDRGEKFVSYRRIPSFREYLLVSQDRMRIERFVRQPSGDWLMTEFSGAEAVVVLSSIRCEIPLAELYRKVPLPPQPMAPPPGPSAEP